MLEGLDRAMAVKPGGGWVLGTVTAQGTLGGRIGATARAEVGERFARGWSVFGRTEATVATGLALDFGVGIGIRGEW